MMTIIPGRSRPKETDKGISRTGRTRRYLTQVRLLGLWAVYLFALSFIKQALDHYLGLRVDIIAFYDFRK